VAVNITANSCGTVRAEHGSSINRESFKGTSTRGASSPGLRVLVTTEPSPPLAAAIGTPGSDDEHPAIVATATALTVIEQ
jgi:hypothetical protein